MSPTGQLRVRPEDLATPRPVVAFAADYPPDHRIDWHDHTRHQFVYATAGVLTVHTEDGSWVVPPQFGVWVPAGTRHALAMHGAVALRTVYPATETAPLPPARCGVFQVTPLLRELILRVMHLPHFYDEAGADGRLVSVLLDELSALPPAPLHLPWPCDPRAVRVAEALQTRPADRRPLADWARHAGAGERTLARLFARETGLSFRTWRRRARMLHALQRLASGAPVTATALDCGYDSLSAFVAAFRRELRESPGRYVCNTQNPT